MKKEKKLKEEHYRELNTQIRIYESMIKESMEARRIILESNCSKLNELELTLKTFDESINIRQKEIDNLSCLTSHKAHRSCKLKSSKLVSKERQLASQAMVDQQEDSINSETFRGSLFDEQNQRFKGKSDLNKDYRQINLPQKERKSRVLGEGEIEGVSVGSFVGESRRNRLIDTEVTVDENENIDLLDENGEIFVKMNSNSRKRSETVDHLIQKTRRASHFKRGFPLCLFTHNYQLEEGVYCVQVKNSTNGLDKSLEDHPKIRPRYGTCQYQRTELSPANDIVAS